MSLKTPLARAQGLGSAKSGAMHFWHQRATAVALVPLTIWFVYVVVRFTGAELYEVKHFFANPINASLMLIFVLAGLYHMTLGVQVIIEDYIHREGTKLALFVLNQFAGLALAVVCTIAILRLAL
ncbi:MAG: succinate dehydrogenase, hydrophobic membrane anchor protein [Alphaproteobacteria bacterium]|nr:succinate dehydrogenase, hydrophobic membrane anchor protein [Alphaproteobacteria bacterium]